MADETARVGEAPVIFEMEITTDEDLNLFEADVTFVFKKPYSSERLTRTATVTDIENRVVTWTNTDEDFLDVDGNWLWQAHIQTAENVRRKTSFATIKVYPNL